ncbi:LLM class flavin-dependent oxidoreductase [Pseudomonas typographi]|uniref:LLM class flavin-dependent oxidoreductase n=1 Tax=Pseudomonas typographi TaxID=2715964 RepID=A0ABR7Z0S9_9PSED|nr:LLM class flavin-dependent oxidoreductase [Pseudomonas typographi]MBD1589296.1 LLM class flavin-dependent oxidoreductase [Pseudomonas typographi]MBD1598973.1 LLM class flavin-dependent oxidoreductase [Pseudomonas typographi]
MTHAPRQLHLAAFLLSGPVIHSHAAWRHPNTLGHFLEPEYYARTARVVEEGLFDFLFFADRLAVGDQMGGSREFALRYGAQDAARLDPLPLLAYLVGQTRRLGLGCTRSTTYYEPAHVARAFATLDHLSKGRAAWNIVTSMNDSEGRLFGKAKHLEHDLRYDRADEFVEVACKLWNSWAPGALKLDRASGELADPAGVTSVNHNGTWFQVEGPLNIPRSPQGRPVLIQAGSSGRGRRFGARWAEAIFTIQPNLAAARAFRDDVRSQAQAAGRNADHCKVLTAVMPFIGASEAEARAKRDQHNALARPELGLVTLSSQLNFDFSAFSLDTTVGALAALPDTPPAVAEKLLGQGADTTLETLGRSYAASVRVPQWVGTGAQVAEQLAGWFEQGGCDGYVISPGYLPGSFSEFVEAVVPHLQRRGLYRRGYEGSTLREHLGLPPLG